MAYGDLPPEIEALAALEKYEELQKEVDEASKQCRVTNTVWRDQEALNVVYWHRNIIKRALQAYVTNGRVESYEADQNDCRK